MTSWSRARTPPQALAPAVAAALALSPLTARPAFAQVAPPTANVENVVGQILLLIRDGSKKLSERLAEIFASTSELGTQAGRVLSLMTDLNGLPALWQALPLMAAMWAVAGRARCTWASPTARA